MSLDASVFLFFPSVRTRDTLLALRSLFRRRKFVLGIQVGLEDGEMVRLPVKASHGDLIQYAASTGKSTLVKVPTISKLFPDVIGEEPIFRLENGTQIGSMEAEIAYRHKGEVIDTFPVGLELARGQDYLLVSLDAPSNAIVNEFFKPRFRSQLTKLLTAGEGIVAAYHAMGEWSSFSDHSPIEDTDKMPDEVDALASFLIEAIGKAD